MIWRDIKGYEGLYKVSDTGLIMSFKKSKPIIMKQWKRSSYKLVDLWKDGVRDIRSVHVLVYETFNGPLDDDKIVHHKDHDKDNNSLNNLEALTVLKHNQLHCCGRPAWNKGVSTPKEISTKVWNKRFQKLIPKFLAICEARDKGISVKQISKDFGICTRQVYSILKRREIYVKRMGTICIEEQQN